jgi:hypothetical protein
MSPETQKSKLKIMHFAPEGYVSSSDIEYLDQLLELLKANNMDPADLVFSGFDGRSVAEGQPPARHNAIYVMNEPGWRYAVSTSGDVKNPAEYAERHHHAGSPCLGIYDKGQLIKVYDHDPPKHPSNTDAPTDDIDSIRIEGTDVLPFDPDEAGVQHFDQIPHEDYIEQREEFMNIVPGDPLSEISVDVPLESAVIHKDYPHNPDASPTDALVGLVYLEEPAADKTAFGF